MHWSGRRRRRRAAAPRATVAITHPETAERVDGSGTAAPFTANTGAVQGPPHTYALKNTEPEAMSASKRGISRGRKRHRAEAIRRVVEGWPNWADLDAREPEWMQLDRWEGDVGAYSRRWISRSESHPSWGRA